MSFQFTTTKKQENTIDLFPPDSLAHIYATKDSTVPGRGKQNQTKVKERFSGPRHRYQENWKPEERKPP